METGTVGSDEYGVEGKGKVGVGRGENLMRVNEGGRGVERGRNWRRVTDRMGCWGVGEE